MTSPRQHRPLYPMLDNVYVRAFGELAVAVSQLRTRCETPSTPAWDAEAAELLEHAEHALEAFATGPVSERGATMTLTDGTAVVADTDAIQRLGKRIVAHLVRRPGELVGGAAGSEPATPAVASPSGEIGEATA